MPQKCHVTLASFQKPKGCHRPKGRNTHKQSSISEMYFFRDLTKPETPIPGKYSLQTPRFSRQILDS